MNGRTLGVMAALLAGGATMALGVAAGGASTTAGPYKLAGTFGKPGTGSGQFSGAKGIAVAANGNVYIADSNNNRIEVFSKSGAFRSKWGTIGTANGQFTGRRTWRSGRTDRYGSRTMATPAHRGSRPRAAGRRSSLPRTNRRAPSLSTR